MLGLDNDSVRKGRRGKQSEGVVWVNRTSSVGGMLANLPDELRDDIPLAFASGIVELVQVAPGLDGVRLVMGKRLRLVCGQAEKRQRAGGRGRILGRGGGSP